MWSVLIQRQTENINQRIALCKWTNCLHKVIKEWPGTRQSGQFDHIKQLKTLSIVVCVEPEYGKIGYKFI